jgi:hypothetical protein
LPPRITLQPERTKAATRMRSGRMKRHRE